MIQKLSNKKFRVDITVRVDKRVHHSGRIVNGTRADAEAASAELRRELGRRHSLKARTNAVRTFKDVAQLFRSSRTVWSASRMRMLRLLERPLNDVPLAQFAQRLEAYLNDVRAAGHEPLATQLTKMARAVFNVALKHQAVSINPVSARFRMTPARNNDRILTPVEEARLLAACPAHLLPLVSYALQVPVRVTEALKLRVDAVDVVGRRVHIRNETAKGGRGSIKPLTADLLAHVSTCTGEYVFTDARGRPMSSISTDWLATIAAANLPGLRFHSLRHCAVTKLLNRGIPAAQVAALAGWSSAHMVKVYYTAAAGEAVDAFFRSDVTDNVTKTPNLIQ